MKCPKCEYLGFDTGDRCKHCGYNFSLVAERPPDADREPLADFDLRGPDQPPPAFRGEPALPLFTNADSDEPLVKVPAVPRAPLSVRRTPDTPRLRAAAKLPREMAPTLEFREEPETPSVAEAVPARSPHARSQTTFEPSSIGRRVGAAALDQLILLAIDTIVFYFTLRMVDLSWADWRAVPPIPMAAFLAALQLAYFTAFTTFGGQTIGKMASGIRVVADSGRLVDPASAVRRSLVATLSLVTLGIGYLPALVATDRRALHDRVAGTRVVAPQA